MEEAKKTYDPKARLEKMMSMTEEELLAIVNDLSQPYFERKIAIAINKGDWKTIQSMMNQVYGGKHAGGRPTREMSKKKELWEDRRQENPAQLKKFIYQDHAQSNNPITEMTLFAMRSAFLVGSNIKEAMEAAGITRAGYDYWLKRMPNDLKEEWLFLVEKWRNNMVLKARTVICDNLDDPMTSKWYLERKRRDEFATRTEQELKKVEKFRDLSDDDLEAMIGEVNGTDD